MTSILTVLDRTARQALRLITLPLLQAPEEALMGGQAVIEGVMMRSPHSYAVAVRQPSGSLAVTQAYLDRPSERHPWLKYPILRGLGVLGQALVLGIRALRYSAEQALEEPGSGGFERRKTQEARGTERLDAGCQCRFLPGFFHCSLQACAALSGHRHNPSVPANRQ